MNHRPVTYRDCKHNTSKSSSFVGYCDLYLDKNGAGKFVECKKCPCDDFEFGVKE